MSTFTVDRSITGPIRCRTGGLLETLSVNDSVLQGLASELPGALTALRDADGMLSALNHHAATTPLRPGSPASSRRRRRRTRPRRPHRRFGRRRRPGRRRPAGRHRRPVDLDRRPLRRPAAARLHRRSRPRPSRRRGRPRGTQPGTARRGVPPRSGRRGDRHRRRPRRADPRRRCWGPPGSTGSNAANRYSTTWCGSVTRRTDACASRPGRPTAHCRTATSRCRSRPAHQSWSVAATASGATRNCPTAPTGRSSAATPAAPPSLLTGSHDGSEMGAFCHDAAAIKDRSLLIKLQEYLPIGLSPVLIHLPNPDPDGEYTRGRPWPPM